MGLLLCHGIRNTRIRGYQDHAITIVVTEIIPNTVRSQFFNSNSVLY